MTRNFVSRLGIVLIGAYVAIGWAVTADGKAIKEQGVQIVADNDLLLNPAQTYSSDGGEVEWPIPSIAIKEKGVQFTALDGASPFPAGGGALALNVTFNFAYEIEFELDGQPPIVTSGTGTGHVAGGSTALEPGVFQLEMLEFNISGMLDPMTPFLLRESPTLSSTGVTTLTSLGGGQYQIDSFFDVFTELSLDGGATWVPATAQVPEPSALALAALAAIGFAAHVRRGRTDKRRAANAG